MTMRFLAISALLASLAAAQQRHKLVINAETPEGQILQQIGQESDDTKKVALIDDYLAKYPQHEGVTWALGQSQPALLKLGLFDRAMEAGDKALAIDPTDLDISYNALKAAEGKKDPDAVMKWSERTSAIARTIVGAAKPDDEDEAKQRADYAKQIDTYTEYALYASALQPGSGPKITTLVEALMARNPKSQYLPKLYGAYLNAASQGGNPDKTVAAADKVLAADPTNENALLTSANTNMTRNKNPEKVIECANKLVEVMSSKPLPEGMSEADWNKKKTTMIGLGHWMAGVTAAAQGKLADADKALRAALPDIKDNSQLLGIGLFQLGLADYKMGKSGKNKALIQDALRFSTQSAAIKGPFQTQAATNVKAIKQELGLK